MIRFPLSVAMFAICLVAWQCTASTTQPDNNNTTANSGGGGGDSTAAGGGGGGSSSGSTSTIDLSSGGEGGHSSNPSISAPKQTSATSTNPNTVSVSSQTGDNSGGSDNSKTPGVPTNGQNGSVGTGLIAGSNNNTTTDVSAAETSLSSEGGTHSSASGGGSSTTPGSETQTGDGITESGSRISEDTQNGQLQDNAGTQSKKDALQKQGTNDSLPTSDHSEAEKQKQEEEERKVTKLLKTTGEDTATSENVQRNSDTTNINKKQTRGEEKAGTPTDPKTVSNVPSNKGATKTPKPEPIITTSTGIKINSTTTTAMEEDVQPNSDANETSKTPTTILTNKTKALEQLQTLDKNDGSSSTHLLFAFVILLTLAVVSVVPVSY